MPKTKKEITKKEEKKVTKKVAAKVKAPVKKIVKKEVKKEAKKKEPIKEVVVDEVKVETPVVLETKDEIKKVKPLKKGFIAGNGRRKTATARVFLWEEKGDFTVNGLAIEKYFPSLIDQSKWIRPFHIIGISHPEAKYSASIKVQGSGKPSQMDAIVLGIAKALCKIDPEFDKALRKQGLLTRDSRMVERKKPYLHKARKRPQYSKR
jgi:small subunit ribosomal protein S9